MSKFELNTLFDEVEFLEEEISELDLIILEYEIIKNYFKGRTSTDPLTKEDVEELVCLNHYLSEINNTSIRVNYNKKKYIERLEQIKNEIDVIIGGSENDI